MNLEPQYQPIQLPIDGKLDRIRKVVQVFHPGYNPPYIFLNLRATDDGSLCYILVYYACCIIAGNIWDESEGSTGPFLSTCSNLSTAERYIPVNHVIPAGIYYFHVPNSHRVDSNHTQPYPIVPIFDHWVFPNKPVPKPWKDLEADKPTRTDSADDLERASCTVTAQLIGLEGAHVMPATTQSWLKANKMHQFITAEIPNATHSAVSNKIQLRRDVHTLFDDNFLTLVPKPDAAIESRYRLTSHLLTLPKKHYNANTEAHTLFHNRPCKPIPHVPIELLFARFAWAIFTSGVIKTFADNADDELYSVLVLQKDKDGTTKQTQEMLSINKLPSLLSKATGNRKTAGEKRNHGQMSKSHDYIEQDNVEYLGKNWIFSTRTGQMEPNSDSDTEYPIARKRRRNLIFSTRTGQLEPNSDSDGNSDSDDNGDDDSNGARSDDGGSLSSYSPFFSDNNSTSKSFGDGDAELDHTALEIRMKPDLSFPPANPGPVPDLSSSVASLGSSDCNSSSNGDHVLGSPIAVPINDKVGFEHDSDNHVH